MFHVGYVLSSGHVQFGDFWKCLSIFRKATKLQKNRKTGNKREKETYLAYLEGPVGSPPGRPSPAPLLVISHLSPVGREACGRRACPGHLLLLPTP